MMTIDREIPVETPPHFTEGAFMHERGGTYYLSYSSGSYRHDSYQVHYATAPSPTGPWAYRGKIVERSEEHTSELQSLMRISYDVFCLKKKQQSTYTNTKYLDDSTPTT